MRTDVADHLVDRLILGLEAERLHRGLIYQPIDQVLAGDSPFFQQRSGISFKRAGGRALSSFGSMVPEPSESKRLNASRISSISSSERPGRS